MPIVSRLPVLTNCHIAIIGLHSIGESLARELCRRGVGSLILIDPYQKEYFEAIDTKSNLVDSTKTREQVIAAKLLQEGFQDSIIQLSNLSSITEESLDTAIYGACAIVHTFEEYLPISSYWVNNIALKNKIPAIFIRQDAKQIKIGPFVATSIDSACYVCVRARELACAENIALAIKTEEAKTSRRNPIKYIKHNEATPHEIELELELCAIKLVCEDLVRWFSSENEIPISTNGVILIDETDKAYRRNHVLTRPDCPVCIKYRRIEELQASVVWKSARAALTETSSFDTLINAHTGLIKSMGILDNVSASEPLQPYVAHSLLANYSFSQSGSSNRCFGKGFDIQEALISSFAEALERYSGHCWNLSALTNSTFADINGKSIDPRELILFHDTQYEHLNYMRFSEQLEMEWVEMTSVSSKDSYYVPSLAVFMNRSDSSLPGYIAPTTTNGLAAGRSLQESIKTALLEVIERDAFMITWMAQMPCTAYKVSTHPDQRVLSLAKAYADIGVDLELYECPVDHPARVFIAIAWDRTRSQHTPYVAVGLGADFTAISAARRAVLEAIQVRKVLIHRLRSPRVRARMNTIVKNPTLVEEPEDHALFYASGCNTEAFEFLNKNRIYNDWPYEQSDDIDAKYSNLLSYLEGAGYKVLYRELTPSDISYRYEINVSRVVVPGFQPIHFGYNERRLGGKRLFQLPHTLGFSPRPLTPIDINDYPHPFN